jgi:hypothetical protein
LARHLKYTLLFSFIQIVVIAQIGGSSNFRFLNIPMTARAAGIGGNSMSVWGNDVNLIHSNPALLNKSMHRQAALNYCNYVSNMNFGYLAYAHHFDKAGTFAASMNFLIMENLKGLTNWVMKPTHSEPTIIALT